MQNDRIVTRRELLKTGLLGGGLLGASLAGCNLFDQKTRDARRTAQAMSLGNLGVTQKRFAFAIWGDPQVAYWAAESEFDDHNNRRKWEEVNPRLRQTVELTNRLGPEFTVTLGDNVHGTGEWEHWKIFVEIAGGLDRPIYPLMGNHDHARAIEDRPSNPLGTLEFGNFLYAQRKLNAPEFAHYSFDAGDWHFILYSQPGCDDHTRTPSVSQYAVRTEYLEWLETDLYENRRRPTFFFTHHPLLPAGSIGMDFYGPDAAARRKLMHALTRHGNVKYAFFGHVHNSVASVPKISWRYRDAAFIVVPNAANWTRGYLYRETYRSSWGAATVECNGTKITGMNFHTLAGETVRIEPNDFPEYDDRVFGYLTPPGAWPAEPALRNGDFGDATLRDSWFPEAYQKEDTPPRTSIALSEDAATGRCLALESRSGVGRLDLLACVRQAVRFPEKDAWPVLRFRYRIPKADFSGPKNAAGIVAVSGWNRDDSRTSVFTLTYQLGASFTREQAVSWRSLAHTGVLTATPVLDGWTEMALNVRADFEKVFPALDWNGLDADNLVVMLAASSVADQKELKNAGTLAIMFDDVQWETPRSKNAPTPGFA